MTMGTSQLEVCVYAVYEYIEPYLNQAIQIGLRLYEVSHTELTVLLTKLKLSFNSVLCISALHKTNTPMENGHCIAMKTTSSCLYGQQVWMKLD